MLNAFRHHGKQRSDNDWSILTEVQRSTPSGITASNGGALGALNNGLR
ncbi:hypothetical protein OWM54_22420 [Myxococcus sp. MISCRS1]|nr:hypothetical protein [Myxococcus sp. MISCRS1]MCY0999894.1 hypothetical protein [Myxococcus sp. MISCRS1]